MQVSSYTKSYQNTRRRLWGETFWQWTWTISGIERKEPKKKNILFSYLFSPIATKVVQQEMEA